MSAVIAENLKLRPMLAEDVPAIMAIEERVYPSPWTAGIFRDCLRVQYDCWVMVDLEERLAGYSVLSAGAGEAHLLNIAVAPEYQGQGAGRSLLLHMLERARRHAVETVFLEVRPSNATAMRLYGSVGFVEIGRRPGYYPDPGGREDALVFALVF